MTHHLSSSRNTRHTSSEAGRLAEFMDEHPRLTVLTGAGISADSGIPTYRDASGRWLPATPIQHQEFIADSSKRQRYWSRSLVGWPAMRDARPNAAHYSLTQLEDMGRIELLITQNVDRLHQRAGSINVVDLHGRLDRVICLNCEANISRQQMQIELETLNPKLKESSILPRPDGDADVPDALVSQVTVPSCKHCSGTLMPDVVFFGGTVPKPRVEKCMDAIDNCDALVVIGSSLTVYSGFRFCRRASALNKPLILINPGTTRADNLAEHKFTSDCATLLEQSIEQLRVWHD
ncbi:MAG: NAD-dependent protein deacetylase [Halioglobus sp.]